MSNFEKEVQALQEEINAEAQSQQAPVANSSVGSSELEAQLAQLEAFAAMDPSVREDQMYKDLQAQLKNVGKQASSSQHDDEEEEEDEDDENEGESEEEDSEKDSENPFFSEKPAKKLREIPINFDVPDEFIGIMKAHFGVDGGLPVFLNSVQTWRNQAQEASELRKTQEALELDLKSLPYELKMAINTWSKGEDYMTPMLNMKRLDYEGDFSKQEVETLVERYLPEQYDELLIKLDSSELSEQEFTKQIGLLSRATKQMFEKDKQALKDEREGYVERIEKQQKQFERSALLSVDDLSKAYPGFRKSDMNKIRTTLIEGKLDDLFFNSDGTYKPEAAKLVAFALNGEKLLSTVKGRAKREGESEANQRIVDSSPKTLKKGNKGASVNSGVDMDQIQHLQGAFKKDPYS